MEADPCPAESGVVCHMTCSVLPWQLCLFAASSEASDKEHLPRQGRDILLPCQVPWE